MRFGISGYFLVILRGFGCSGHFWTFLGTLGTFGYFCAQSAQKCPELPNLKKFYLKLFFGTLCIYDIVKTQRPMDEIMWGKSRSFFCNLGCQPLPTRSSSIGPCSGGAFQQHLRRGAQPPDGLGGPDSMIFVIHIWISVWIMQLCTIT